jgi:hypothetical protein
MKCPSCYRTFCESETARYCSSCGYIEYYWGKIQPTNPDIKQRLYEKWKKYLEEQKLKEEQLERNNNNGTND